MELMPFPVNSESRITNSKKSIYHLPFTIHRHGFTLIELLVVISIIAILMAVATVSYTNAQQKGRDNKRKSDLKAIQQALEVYYQQNGKYPFKRDDSNSYLGRMACVNTAATGVKWGDAFTCSSITYMNPTPKDPVFPPTTTQADEKDYYYESNNSSTPANQTYVLSARLENTNDRDFKGHSSTNITYCTPEGYTNSTTYRRNYCVINP